MSELQREFWRGFRKHLRAHSNTLRVTKAADNYMNFSTGRDGVMITTRFAPTDFRIEVEITVNESPGGGKPLFNAIRNEHEEAAKTELAANVLWIEEPLRPEGHIRVKRSCDPDVRSRWPEYFEWLQNYGEILHSWATMPRVQTP